MKFDRTETIEGLTMMQIRDLFTNYSKRLSLESLEHYLENLDLDSSIALALLEGLEANGFVTKQEVEIGEDKTEFVWEATEKAWNLSFAKFTKRLSPQKAAEMMDSLLNRCQATLRSDNPTVGVVTKIRLFGSYSRAAEHEDFGDLDIVMECDPKFADPRVQSDFVDEVTGSQCWQMVSTWGTVAKYLRNRSGYLSICLLHNYEGLQNTNPKKEPILFNSDEGGRLDVQVPAQFRKSKPQRAAYRRGWCDGRNGWLEDHSQFNEALKPIYQQSFIDGAEAIPAAKKTRAFPLTEFNVLLLSENPPTTAPVCYQVHQCWELPNPVQTLYLIRASVHLKTSLKDCIGALKAQNIPAIAAELKQELYQFELHAGRSFGNDSFAIEAKFFSPQSIDIDQASGEHVSMLDPLLVYSKGSEFLGAIGCEWKRYWGKKELEKGYYYYNGLTRRYSEDHEPSCLIKDLTLSQGIVFPKLLMKRSFSFVTLRKSECPEVDIGFQVSLYRRPDKL